MDSIFCVEQINVPPELGTIMKQYTKAVLRDKPQDLYKYSANFFAALSGQSAPFDREGHFVESHGYEPIEHFVGTELDKAEATEPTYSINHEGRDVVQDIFNEYDVNNDGRLSKDAVPALLADLQRVLGLNESETIGVDEVMGVLHMDEKGTVDLLELRQLLVEPNNSF